MTLPLWLIVIATIAAIIGYLVYCYREGLKEPMKPKLNSQSADAQRLAAIDAGMKRAIQEKKAENPHIASIVAGREMLNQLLRALKDERGVHMETALCALGALAGYSCQASVRAIARMEGRKAVFVEIQCKDGKKYLFGDELNSPLIESRHSVYSIVAGTINSLGCQITPNIHEICEHNAKSLGGASFGVPRTPDANKPKDLPISYLVALWPHTQKTITRYCEHPSEWPVAYAFALQEALKLGKDAGDLSLFASIALESAVAMSKVDLGESIETPIES